MYVDGYPDAAANPATTRDLPAHPGRVLDDGGGSITRLRITFTDPNGNTFNAIVIGYAAAAALATALSNSTAASGVSTVDERNGEWEVPEDSAIRTSANQPVP